jgi:Flp pilus assembly protein TadG
MLGPALEATHDQGVMRDRKSTRQKPCGWTVRFKLRRRPVGASAARRCLGRRADSGQSLVEFALILPVLMIVILGILKFGTSYNHYLTLTDAVRSGARQLALERGQGGSDPNIPCQDAVARILAAAGGLDKANLKIVVNSSYVYASSSASGTCATLVSGNAATVSATYPCDATIFGIDFAPGCKLSATASERTE